MVYIMLAPGFEEMEALTPCDLLRRANVPTALVGVGGREIVGSHGIRIAADMTTAEMDLTSLDMIVLPGGREGVRNLGQSKPLLDALRFAFENGKWIAAICAAPTILAELGFLEGKCATCYPDAFWTDRMAGACLREAAVIRDGNVITGTSAGCSMAFGLELTAAMTDRETAERVAGSLVIR